MSTQQSIHNLFDALILQLRLLDKLDTLRSDEGLSNRIRKIIDGEVSNYGFLADIYSVLPPQYNREYFRKYISSQLSADDYDKLITEEWP